MDLRRSIFSRGMKLLQHPTVAKLLADPRAMDLFVGAMRTRQRAADLLDEARRRLVQLVGLATEQEVRDLKVVIRDLERKVRNVEDDR